MKKVSGFVRMQGAGHWTIAAASVFNFANHLSCVLMVYQAISCLPVRMNAQISAATCARVAKFGMKVLPHQAQPEYLFNWKCHAQRTCKMFFFC